ncbi:NUDIX hydrolase, partial [Candidatus Gottesmanbacteria bacterium]|nr:NUDIX hydrolase [Candidatus Gottesmanbacteria bacterium]
CKGLDLAAKLLLKKVTGIDNGLYYQEQLYTFFDNAKNQRIIDVVYFILIPIYTVKKYLKQNWYPVDGKLPISKYNQNIVNYSLQRLRWKVDYTNVVYSLLPEEFSFFKLQSTYEAILGRTLDKRNFRKKIMSLNLLKPTGIKKQSGKARPAYLYRFKDRELKYVKII